MLKLIWDNGRPSCLPRWAREEIVRRRDENAGLRVRCAELRVELAKAQGKSHIEAIVEGYEEKTGLQWRDAKEASG